MSFLDRFNGTVVRVVQDRNILPLLGERFLVDGDPWRQRWFLSSFPASNGTFDDMTGNILSESQNRHGQFDTGEGPMGGQTKDMLIESLSYIAAGAFPLQMYHHPLECWMHHLMIIAAWQRRRYFSSQTARLRYFLFFSFQTS